MLICIDDNGIGITHRGLHAVPLSTGLGTRLVACSLAQTLQLGPNSVSTEHLLGSCLLNRFHANQEYLLALCKYALAVSEAIWQFRENAGQRDSMWRLGVRGRGHIACGPADTRDTLFRQEPSRTTIMALLVNKT